MIKKMANRTKRKLTYESAERIIERKLPIYNKKGKRAKCMGVIFMSMAALVLIMLMIKMLFFNGYTKIEVCVWENETMGTVVDPVSFMDEVDKANIKTHIMAGIIPLKAAGMAKYMNENVPGIAVPQDMIDRLAAAAAEGKEKGVKGLPTQLGIEMQIQHGYHISLQLADQGIS